MQLHSSKPTIKPSTNVKEQKQIKEQSVVRYKNKRS